MAIFFILRISGVRAGDVMLMIWLLLAGSALTIYFSCEFFVNSIEWVGRRLNVGKTAVGTILAAFGTALPESVVTFVAVVFGKDTAHRDIGVGAALGGPLALGTIAYMVVGLVFFLNRKKLSPVFLTAEKIRMLTRDQCWFLVIFVIKITVGLFAFVWKPWLAVLFLGTYAVYMWTEIRRGDVVSIGTGIHEEQAAAEDELEPLKFRPHDAQPGLGWALTQTLVSVVIIFLSSQLFVRQLESLAPLLGIAPYVVALILSPVATELPEILNAVIWVRQGKQALALSNISGSMMIQATIPTALVLIFTPWVLSPALIWAGVVTGIALLAQIVWLRTGHPSGGKLACFGLFYLVFAAGLRWLM